MSSKLVLGKREKNKEAVREQLLEVAMHLFSTKGYENTTVADIVTECKIGRGTFYNYFTDVRHIFDKVTEKTNEQIGIITNKARKSQSTVYDMLYESFKAYFDFASSPTMIGFHKLNQAYIRGASYKSDVIRNIVKELLGDIKGTSDKTVFKSDREQLLLSYVLISAPAELFLNNMSVTSQFDNDEVAKFLATLFTSGILKDKD